MSFVINLIKNKIKDKKLLLIICICLIIIAFLVIKGYDNYLVKQETETFALNNDNESIYDVESKENTNEDLENIEETENGKEIENTEDENIQVNEEESEIDNICIYITGEVNNTGVYYLNIGSRIIDAINLAGGFTSKANISKINLAFVLEDGMKVNIPSDDDLKNNNDFEYITMSSGDGANDYNNTNNETVSSQESSKTDIVNINTATQTELETLPGIGPSLALKIIEYRKENGDFASIEDIKNVSGIGDSRFNDIKNYIKVK